MTDQNDSDEQDKPRRPRVVDKRISARSQEAASHARSRIEPEPASPVEPAASETPASPEGASNIPVEPHSPGDDQVSEQTPPSQVWTPEQQQAAEQLAQQIRETPTESWVLNVAMTLIDVAGVKLDAGDASGAGLAIDALAGLSKEVAPKLGDAGAALNRALSDLRMAYAETVSTPPQEQ